MNCPVCGINVLDVQSNCHGCGAALGPRQTGGQEQPGGFYGQPSFASAPAFGETSRYGGSSEAVQVTPLMVEHLQATRPWVKFMGVMLFISVGLLFLGGLLMMVALSSVRGVGASPAIGLLYWLFGLLYIAPAIFLNRYAGAIRELLQGGGATSMEKALESQKSFWRYVGILTLVILCIYALFLVIAILIGIGGAMRMR